jgi:hypothetical protein
MAGHLICSYTIPVVLLTCGSDLTTDLAQLQDHKVKARNRAQKRERDPSWSLAREGPLPTLTVFSKDYMPQRNIIITEDAMSRSQVMIAVLALITPTLAAELPKSGNFKTPSAFKGIEQATQVGGRVPSHGVVYKIVTADNPLHIKRANCPYSNYPPAEPGALSF